jgi:hypothetical protein
MVWNLVAENAYLRTAKANKVDSCYDGRIMKVLEDREKTSRQ